MALVGHMELELVQAVGVVVAGVASQLHWVCDIKELNFPLIPQTALLYVIDMVQSLQVLVCLAVELKVCFQIGLVTAELAYKITGYEN